MGSVTGAVWAFCRFIYKNSGALDYRHRSWMYYLSQLILAFVAGGLAVALDADTPKKAFVIGLTAGMILDKMVRRPPDLE